MRSLKWILSVLGCASIVLALPHRGFAQPFGINAYGSIHSDGTAVTGGYSNHYDTEGFISEDRYVGDISELEDSGLFIEWLDFGPNYPPEPRECEEKNFAWSFVSVSMNPRNSLINLRTSVWATAAGFANTIGVVPGTNAEADAYGAFMDELTITSHTLPYGTPVIAQATVLVTGEVSGQGTFDGTELQFYFSAYPSDGPGFDIGAIVTPTSGHSALGHPLTALLFGRVGQVIPFTAQMIAQARAFASFYAPPGVASEASIDVFTLSDRTAHFYIDVLTPGVSYTTASGHTYFPPVCGNSQVEAGEECDDGNTASGDGCSATCTLELSKLIPGGGSAGTDCFLEWLVTNPNNPPDKKGLPTGSQVCTDGDPTCDFDDVAGQCTFHVAACVNVEDSRLVGRTGVCQPQDIVEVDTSKVPASEKDLLDNLFVAFGGTAEGVCTDGKKKTLCKANADCDTTPGQGDGVCETQMVSYEPPLTQQMCSDDQMITLNLKATTKGFKKVSKSLPVQVTTAIPSGGRQGLTDSDVIKLTCLPAGQ